jgi:hypothetical protein
MAIRIVQIKPLTRLLLFTLIIGLLAPLISCGESPSGPGKLETWGTEHSGFTRLDVRSAFEVYVNRGDSYHVTITTDDSLLQSLDIEKKEDTLHIGLKEPDLPVDATLKAEITMPDLRGINLSGASKATVNGFSSRERLEFDVSGASSLHIIGLESGVTEFHVSGASDVSGDVKTTDCIFDLSKASIVDLQGSARNVFIQASESSRVILDDFEVGDAEVKLSGDSYATVNARGGLDVALSGTSDLEYAGGARLGDINLSCASDIVKNEREG